MTLDYRQRLRAFFLPPLTRAYVRRAAWVTVIALVLFGGLFPPFRIHGRSMEPTYADGGFLLGFRFRYTWQPPRPGDVVLIRLGGTRVMYLKRVVAVAGETVAFQAGRLLINGAPRPEPWVRHAGDWTLPERTVRPDSVYVVGDNRSVPIEDHEFGQVALSRIAGGPLW